MPKCHLHPAAARFAGEVFGKILDRDADIHGYQYVLHCLETGSKSVREIVVELVSSDEFYERFLARKTPGQAVMLIHRLLLGRAFMDEVEEMEAARELAANGIDRYANKLTASPEYMEQVGSNKVPGAGHPVTPARAVEFGGEIRV